MEERENGVYEMWRDYYKEAMNVYYLGRLDTRGFYLFTTFSLSNPKDIAGRKIYAFPAIQAWVKALGAAPTSLAAAEQYTALEQGLVEGGVIPVTNIMSWGMQEVIDYMVDHEIYPASGITLTMNLDKFKSLPKHLQEIMKEVAVENEKEMVDWFNEENKRAKRQLLDAGVEFITFSPEDAKLYVDLAVQARWEDYKKRVSPEVYNKATEMLGYK